MPCRLVIIYRCLGGSCCLHIRCQSSRARKIRRCLPFDTVYPSRRLELEVCQNWLNLNLLLLEIVYVNGETTNIKQFLAIYR